MQRLIIFCIIAIAFILLLASRGASGEHTSFSDTSDTDVNNNKGSLEVDDFGNPTTDDDPIYIVEEFPSLFIRDTDGYCVPEFFEGKNIREIYLDGNLPALTAKAFDACDSAAAYTSDGSIGNDYYSKLSAVKEMIELFVQVASRTGIIEILLDPSLSEIRKSNLIASFVEGATPYAKRVFAQDVGWIILEPKWNVTGPTCSEPNPETGEDQLCAGWTEEEVLLQGLWNYASILLGTKQLEKFFSLLVDTFTSNERPCLALICLREQQRTGVR